MSMVELYLTGSLFTMSRYAGSNQISDPIEYGLDGFPDDQGPLWEQKKKAWSKWNITTPNIAILLVLYRNTLSFRIRSFER